MRAHLYLSELFDAFQWVSAASRFENAAYVSRESGRAREAALREWAESALLFPGI
jgi:hypothetical protein